MHPMDKLWKLSTVRDLHRFPNTATTLQLSTTSHSCLKSYNSKYTIVFIGLTNSCLFFTRVLTLRHETTSIEEFIADFLHFREFNDNENIMEKLESLSR